MCSSDLVKGYGAGALPITIGIPYRKLYKPVVNTTVIGISGVASPVGWSVSTTTGIVTFAANKTRAITGITKAVQAVISCAGHTFVVGETVHISAIVVGMTQANNKRAVIVSTVPSTSITVDLNTLTYNTYSSGGTLNTSPQAGEAVTGGCLFDLPCRFNSAIDVSALSPDLRDCGGLDVIELLNP